MLKTSKHKLNPHHIEERRQRIAEAVGQHPDWPDWRIAQSLGVSRSTVWVYRRSLGEVRAHSNLGWEKKTPLILEDLRLGKPHKVIVAFRHVSRSRIVRIAQENGLERRPRRGQYA
jgi:hypothetical protein